MNKTVIKNFAIWARKKLIADIKYRASLMGISEKGIASPLPQSTGTTEFFDIGTAEPYAINNIEIKQRENLVRKINMKSKESDYSNAYLSVVEEVAYTWFNRLIAIRFMEVNDYLPSHMRVLSSETGKMEPDIVTAPFDSELSFSEEEERLIIQLKENNKLDELFRMLFIKQCNELNEILPLLFEKTQDYTELLLNLSIIDQDGVVHHLIHDVEEKYFKIRTDDDIEQMNNGEIAEEDLPVGQVEIIGWLYQYYNTDLKDETFTLLKQNVKITKERIPAATQLFTPDWIVRYMVENSVGRLWMDGHSEDTIKNKWKYYLEEANQGEKILETLLEIRRGATNIKPEDIRIIDPCMGSGHILVRCFEILMQIYESQGYSKRDATKLIVEKNIYGLDIDRRASQMAYFAVMMKARQYDRRFFSRKIIPHVYAFEESGYRDKKGKTIEKFDPYFIDYFVNGNQKIKDDITILINEMIDAKEYGSIIAVSQVDFEAIFARFEEIENEISIYRESALNDFLPVIRVAYTMAQKYHVVITNPPYMGSSGMGSKMAKYVKDSYPDSKTDLFAVFVEKCGKFTKANGYKAMITQHAWMFLASFEKLRKQLNRWTTINMAHLGSRAFEEIGGEVVQTTTFIQQNREIKDYVGCYCRLVSPTTQDGKEKMFLAGENRFYARQEDFKKIPGEPVVYWVSDAFRKIFDSTPLGELYDVRQGMTTSDNNRFLRLWYEVDCKNIGFSCKNTDESVKSNKKWFPYNKGGEFRKWYGNRDYVVNYYNNGREMELFHAELNKTSSGGRMKSREFYFKEAITWSFISSSNFGVRYSPEGSIFDVAGSSLFPSKDRIKYITGFLCSSVCSYIMKVLNPTMNFQAKDIKSLPIRFKNSNKIEEIVDECINLSKEDWDAYETSWDFTVHPLVGNYSFIEDAYDAWEKICNYRFNRLKDNENAINLFFNEIYEMGDEISHDVIDKEITVRKADLQREIRSLLSYAVGCMFGRYSLGKEGVIFTGTDWNIADYEKYIPDMDNVIPITDEEYLEDDIITRLCEWLKCAYGNESLENNLDFIAKVLGNKGLTSRDTIRKYFVEEFWSDHCKIYQKRPIYWMYNSGKNNGFKALIYIHRYSSDTMGIVRVDYLHRLQRIYESEINRMQEIIDGSDNSREKVNAAKRKEKLNKQSKECREFDEKLGHLALSRVMIDLDDCIKSNYEKVQVATDGKKYQVLSKI